MRNDDEEVNLKYQYSEFVKRERFQSAQYKNMLALQRTQAVLKNMAPELLTHIGNYPMIIVSDFDREVTMPIDRSDISHRYSCLSSLKSVSTIVLNENSEGNLSRACLDNDNDIESEAGYNTCTSSPTNQSLNSAVWHVGMNPSVYFDAVERGYRPILIAQSYRPTPGRPRCSSV
ncbi:hypothetical protein DPMN_105153 [Dreissena polymorpha]|uniref:Uncharacterized protein n=1 Tax=Dreissena polymorpha TaxID=45954 RepID=A0A9D4HEA3_DREPO|nr:hypothetical protein DPMN_105153 [Dreissena polymorpha]